MCLGLLQALVRATTEPVTSSTHSCCAISHNAVPDAVLAGPSLAVGEHTPACLDEYQRAPNVLDSIKARLNAAGTLPGTAVLTSSTRHDALPRTAQALIGRLHVMTVCPLSQGEIAGTTEDLVTALRDASGLSRCRASFVDA